MKKRSKLKLHRETIVLLEARQLRAGGANCTCSCCPTQCGENTCYSCEYTCLNSCGCPTYNNEWSCICA